MHALFQKTQAVEILPNSLFWSPNQTRPLKGEKSHINIFYMHRLNILNKWLSNQTQISPHCSCSCWLSTLLDWEMPRRLRKAHFWAYLWGDEMMIRSWRPTDGFRFWVRLWEVDGALVVKTGHWRQALQSCILLWPLPAGAPRWSGLPGVPSHDEQTKTKENHTTM